MQRQRADTAERTLALRDDALKRQRDLFAAAERAHKGTHLVAQSESRSLQAEKERRIAAEQRVEQLTLELEGLTKEFQMRTVSHDFPALLQTPLTALIAENREVRGQRDRIDAEREQLAARLLEWMSPGQYLEHAAADYDITKGIETKATARALDPKQTGVEQAYGGLLGCGGNRKRLFAKSCSRQAGSALSTGDVAVMRVQGGPMRGDAVY
jgi:hypothetical protein